MALSKVGPCQGQPGRFGWQRAIEGSTVRKSCNDNQPSLCYRGQHYSGLHLSLGERKVRDLTEISHQKVVNASTTLRNVLQYKITINTEISSNQFPRFARPPDD